MVGAGRWLAVMALALAQVEGVRARGSAVCCSFSPELRSQYGSQVSHLFRSRPPATSSRIFVAQRIYGGGQTEEEGQEDGIGAGPGFVQHRLNVLERVKERISTEAGGSRASIQVSMREGMQYVGVAGQTTPKDIALNVSKEMLSDAVVALVNDDVWDLERPLEADCTLAFLTFDDPRAKEVFWHSSAHILGQALEQQQGALLKFVRYELLKEEAMEMFKYNKYKLDIISRKVWAIVEDHLVTHLTGS
eukprot:757486-Hanusia_phi.AAC.1